MIIVPAYEFASLVLNNGKQKVCRDAIWNDAFLICQSQVSTIIPIFIPSVISMSIKLSINILYINCLYMECDSRKLINSKISQNFFFCHFMHLRYLILLFIFYFIEDYLFNDKVKLNNKYN